MTAIVTNRFRVTNAENFKEDLESAGTSVYIAIAKTDAWSNSYSDATDAIDAPVPADALAEEIEFHNNMIAMKQLDNIAVSHTTPRYNWKTGQVYVPWDDADPQIFTKQFYCITDEFKVYKCLKRGPGASVQKPSQ